MSSESYVIVVDTPSIKRYVFGTDPLNEVRGASAWLDQLNQVEMKQCLCERLGEANVESIYANGGSAQFVVRQCDKNTVKAVCTSMVQYIREQTGGEVRVVYGIAPLEDEASYQAAVQMAHFQLRCQREFATCYRSASLMPTMMECQSASHLPAAHLVDRGADGIDMLSKASYQKDRHGHDAHRRGLWAEWMQHLADTKPWPAEEHLTIIFFITSSDSGSLIIDTITAGGKTDAPVSQRVFWCTAEGAVAIALLLGGGLKSMQAATLATGLPFAFVLIGMCACIAIGLRRASR